MTTQPGLLDPYRVLDLTNERGHFAGKLLADLGADVIKVEPPHGDPARRRGPFVDDIPGPDRSLRWLAWNTNKRSVTIDLDDPAGRDQFLQLAQSADFVLESFAPGHLDDLGLGYDALSAANPGHHPRLDLTLRPDRTLPRLPDHRHRQLGDERQYVDHRRILRPARPRQRR